MCPAIGNPASCEITMLTIFITVRTFTAFKMKSKLIGQSSVASDNLVQSIDQKIS
jgi:hypothetical protein